MKHWGNVRHASHGRLVAFVICLTLSSFLGTGAQAADIEITDVTAYALHDSVNGRRIEVYMTIENAGAAADRLYAVRSRLSGNTMISVIQHSADHGDSGGHASMENMMMDKHLRTTILEVPADGTAVLEHGGSHIMLMEPKETPAIGETFPLTLFFERVGRVSVEAVVEQPAMSN